MVGRTVVELDSTIVELGPSFRRKLLKPRVDKTDIELMESQKSHSPTAGANPPVASCRKKKTEDATFLEDLKDHIDEFINASMDEHKTCFKKTIQKMFGMSKIVAERNSEAKEGESSLPLRTTVSE